MQCFCIFVRIVTPVLSRVLLFSPRSRTAWVTPLTLSSSVSLHHSPWLNLKSETYYTITRNRIDITAISIFISRPTSPVSLTTAKQYIGPVRTCTKKPDKIQISWFGVKNKPKIRICQSGTNMQTLYRFRHPTTNPSPKRGGTKIGLKISMSYIAVNMVYELSFVHLQYIRSYVRPFWWSLVIVRDNYRCLHVVRLHHYNGEDYCFCHYYYYSFSFFFAHEV